ncbi:MAG TPA: triphosphoribosyl-dephospho-CoA synthase [Vicinamibacterales bacterium]|nr:triphosphoribosyl-dephospho-CoA synthase [Vicinamibacterales bacterium]
MIAAASGEATGHSIAAVDVAIAAQLACLLEASAPKPGNVSRGRHFADVGYEAFLASAAAIGGPLIEAGSRPLGETVRLAIEATARWTRSNTNLGIVLLLAPLARAARVWLKPDTTAKTVRLKPDTMHEVAARDAPSPVVSGFSPTLRDTVREVLAQTTVDDAREVYAAIRLAAPGGLGRVAEQDVAGEPTQTLVDVMRLAADRDAIAREYTNAFASTFLVGVPALECARRDNLSWDDAIVETFLTLLGSTPDTHIARRGGAALAAEVSSQARAVLAAGGVRTDEGRIAIERMDRALRDPDHLANPGAAADLTAAAIFVVLLNGGWQRSSGAPAGKGGHDAASR